ncbi:hypothetical protein N7516_010583 [Penicillium verrucosum]|uniref:uncharacterized protein n=1 Tax=Penicillium verrucosum TaxID=60171 RepID=UPI002544FFC2|nr:uncharacterized protein N7516_010583 [Penicillium verrucosum]KAJ5922880.1 hypothetical protein N7516_010583 [Penicillium verrucosum]
MVVYSWSTAPEKVMVDLSIHYTYMLILGDSHDDDPTESMKAFYNTIMASLPQEHPWWQMVNNHLPQVLWHYGPYSGMNTISPTTNFLQGCWIAHHNIMGFPGSLNSPIFLRRMNALGQCVGRSIFPKQEFDKNEVFAEIAATIAEVENWIACANDLLSFYGSSTSCVTRRARSITSASPSIHTLPSANPAANTPPSTLPHNNSPLATRSIPLLRRTSPSAS